mgnify:CR=1 FL=1
MLRDNRIESKTTGLDWSNFNLSEVKLGKVILRSSQQYGTW